MHPAAGRRHRSTAGATTIQRKVFGLFNKSGARHIAGIACAGGYDHAAEVATRRFRRRMTVTSPDTSWLGREGFSESRLAASIMRRHLSSIIFFFESSISLFLMLGCEAPYGSRNAMLPYWQSVAVMKPGE